MNNTSIATVLRLIAKSITCFCAAIWCASAICSERDAPILAVIDFYPFGYWSPKNEPMGMVFDIAKVLEEYSGIPIDARLMSTPRAIRSASIGQNDILFSYKDDEMVPNVTWLGNVGCLVPLLIPRADSQINHLSDLNGRKKVGFVGLGYFDINKKTQWNIEPVILNNNFLMIKMLIRNRIDAIVVNNAVLNAFLANPEIVDDLPEDWQKALGRPIPLDQFETHVSISNNSSFLHLAPNIKKAIIAARGDNKFSAIFKKYGSMLGGHCFDKNEIVEHQWLPHLQ